ncbi:hypothetical protein DRO29_00880, partial [Candidatus Bathyarchaeota archaeon]
TNFKFIKDLSEKPEEENGKVAADGLHRVLLSQAGEPAGVGCAHAPACTVSLQHPPDHLDAALGSNPKV